MLQIIIQGRGGQGAQTAGNLLAAAFFGLGAYAAGILFILPRLTRMGF